MSKKILLVILTIFTLTLFGCASGNAKEVYSVFQKEDLYGIIKNDRTVVI